MIFGLFSGLFGGLLGGNKYSNGYETPSYTPKLVIHNPEPIYTAPTVIHNPEPVSYNNGGYGGGGLLGGLLGGVSSLVGGLTSSIFHFVGSATKKWCDIGDSHANYSLLKNAHGSHEIHHNGKLFATLKDIIDIKFNDCTFKLGGNGIWNKFDLDGDIYGGGIFNLLGGGLLGNFDTKYLNGHEGKAACVINGKFGDYKVDKMSDGSSHLFFGGKLFAVLKNIIDIKFNDFGFKFLNGIWTKCDLDGKPIMEQPPVVVEPPAPPKEEVDYGNDGDDYLYGTSGNDFAQGGIGNDTFHSTGGNDRFEGGEGYNQVDLEGYRADYTISKNDAGEYVIRHNDNGSTITASDIGGLWFTWEAAWYNPADMIGDYQQDNNDNAENQGDNGGNDYSNDGDDFMSGTSGNDYMDGGKGNDTFSTAGGHDTVRGGEGYNQVDLAGYKSDYAFAKNDDGSYVITDHRDGSTITAYDIQGVWFSYDAVWANPEDMLGGNQYDNGGDNGDYGVNVDYGNDGDDFIMGTDGDDDMKGGEGNDTFVGGKGDDRIDGEGGSYNQVDMAGGKEDYTFSKNDDGSYTVTSAEYGTDTLMNINGIWFQGAAEWHNPEYLSA